MSHSQSSGFSLIEVVLSVFLLAILSAFIGQVFAQRTQEVKKLRELAAVGDLLPLVESHIAFGMKTFLETPPLGASNCSGTPLATGEVAFRFNQAFPDTDYNHAGFGIVIATEATLSPVPAEITEPSYLAAREACLRNQDLPGTGTPPTDICTLTSLRFCLVLSPSTVTSPIAGDPSFVLVRYFLTHALNGGPLQADAFTLAEDRGGRVVYQIHVLRRNTRGEIVPKTLAGNFDASTR